MSAAFTDERVDRLVVALERIAEALERRAPLTMEESDRLHTQVLAAVGANLVPFHEAAREIGVDENTLHLMVRAGTFTAMENGNRALCVERASLERFKLGVPSEG